MRMRKRKKKYIKTIIDLIVNNIEEYEEIRDLYFIVKGLKKHNKVRIKDKSTRYLLKAYDIFYKTAP